MRAPPGKSHYEILQVDRRASQEVIQGAYRALLKAGGNHPDLGGSAEAAQRINEAYGVLRDPQSRREYDRYLDMILPGQTPPPLQTQYILICHHCRNSNILMDARHIERARCGNCNKALLPKKGAQRSTDHAKAHRLGMYLFDRGLLDRALHEFDDALRASPRNALYHYWHGRCLYRMHRLEQARKAFGAAASLQRDRFHYQFWLGQVNYSLKDFASAVEGFRQAASSRPHHGPTLLRMASCYFHMGQHDQAAEVLGHAIAREPNRTQLHSLLGVVHLAAKHPEPALEAFEVAEKLDPKDPLIQKYLGMLRK